MTPGWQTLCFGAGLVLFVLGALAAWVSHRLWPVLVALGLAVVTLVPLWNAASAS